MKIPKKYTSMVGTKQIFSGGLFNPKKAVPETEFEVKDIRICLAVIVNLKTHKAIHPTFELLLKNRSMRAARWSRPFPIHEIKFKD